MSENSSHDEHTFRLICGYCDKPFHIRRKVADPDAEGTGEISLECLYCGKTNLIAVPRVYIEEEQLFRGLKCRVVEVKGGNPA